MTFSPLGISSLPHCRCVSCFLAIANREKGTTMEDSANWETKQESCLHYVFFFFLCPPNSSALCYFFQWFFLVRLFFLCFTCLHFLPWKIFFFFSFVFLFFCCLNLYIRQGFWGPLTQLSFRVGWGVVTALCVLATRPFFFFVFTKGTALVFPVFHSRLYGYIVKRHEQNCKRRGRSTHVYKQ